METQPAKLIPCYRFTDLDERAQQRAIDRYRESAGPDLASAWDGEWRESREGFVKHFGINLDRHGETIDSFSDEHIEDLHGVRLWKYLVNNNLVNEKMAKEGCPFTGYCGDYDYLKPVLDFFKRPDTSTNGRELFRDALHAGDRAWEADREHACSDEAIKDVIECNDVLFLEDGRLAPRT